MPDYFPPTKNDPALWNWLESTEAGVKESVGGPDMHWQMKATMGSEDFSFYTQDVPGAFIFLGQGSAGGDFELDDVDNGKVIGRRVMHFPTNTTLHSPRFNMDES